MSYRTWIISAFLVAVGSLFTIPVTLAQSTWTGGNSNNLWTDPLNWSPGVPSSATTGLFNNAAGGFTSISLGGTTQTVGALQFDTSSAASYILGTTGGDVFSITNNTISAGVGAISLTSTVTSSPQAINASVLFIGTTPLITNASTTSALTLGAASTTATLGLQTPGTSSSLTMSVNGATIIVNDVINSIGGSYTAATSAAAGTATGGLIFNVPTSGAAGTVLLNSQSTYSGFTNLNNSVASVTLQIGSSTDTALTSTYTKGPFGTSTVVPNSGTQTPLQAFGADQTVANPFNLIFGFTVSNAATPHNLSLTGPLTFASSASRTVTVSTPGQTFTLGSAANPSTFTLAPKGALNVALGVAASSTLVVNDVIQDNGTPPGTPDTISFNSNGNNTAQGTAVMAGASTYAGSTTINGQTTGTIITNGGQTVQIGISSVGSPGSITSGPFGKGTLIVNGNASAPPTLEAFGADRTVANALTMTSGFFVLPDPAGAHNLTLSGPIANSGKTLTNNLPATVALILGSASSPSTMTLTGGATFQSQTGGGVTVINDAISGALQIITVKSGTVQLTNANTYTGATSVTGGTLLVTNTTGSATGTNIVTLTGSGAVGSGGILAGTGSVSGTVTVGSTTALSQGGVVSPGVSGPGTLNAGSMVLNPLGRYVFEYNATDTTTGGTVNDFISGSGTLNLAALSPTTQFDLNLSSQSPGTVSSGPYTIATFAGGVTGASGDITPDFNFSGTFNNNGSTLTPDVSVVGNSLVLNFVAVPEPSSMMLLGVAAFGVLRRRRR